MAAAAEEDGSLWQELQVLQSIYLEELQVCQEDDRMLLRMTLHPATAADMERQYVCLTLQLALPPKYPDEPPEISVRNPRGMGDEQIDSIINTLRSMATQEVGGPVLYELIEKGKEMLTASNIPRGHCVICLYGFQEGDGLTKTPCYHHFHAHCLARYARHCQETEPLVLCPVCREPLTCDLTKLQEAPPPQQTEEVYTPDARTLLREAELRRIYERQRANGGIIDVEAERNRFFISIQETPASDPAVSTSEDPSEFAPGSGPTLQSPPGSGPTLQSAPGSGPTLQSAPGSGHTLESAPESGPTSQSTPGSGPTSESAPGSGPTSESAPGSCSTSESAPGSCPTLESAPGSGPTLQSAPRSGPTLQSAPRSGPTLQSAPRSGPTLQSAPRSGPTSQSAPRSGHTSQSAPRSGPTSKLSPDSGPTSQSAPGSGPTSQSAPRGPGTRIRTVPASRGHHDGPHWRESRGWGNRPRWRDDFQPRGRGKSRGYHGNRTARPPDNLLEERHGL